MHHILYLPFESANPINLQKLADSDYDKIPMYRQVKFLLDLIKESGEIKLTAKGFLPTKIVKDIYAQGFIKQEKFESGIYKLYKESDSMSINLTRLLLELSGLTKKRNGKLSLTKNGEKILSDNQKLFESIFITMIEKFSWAYFDGYEDKQLGQFGIGFSLILISKYGTEKRLNKFYSEKYLKAFPHFAGQSAANCHSIRTFDRFLDYFGLIEIEPLGKGWNPDKFITKTELFDKLIKVQAHKGK